MDRKRKDRTPPTNKEYGSGETTTTWVGGQMIIRVELSTISDCIVG